MRRANTAIVAVDAGPAGALLSQQTASMTAECELPMPIERQETYLVIRDRETMHVVTVIELQRIVRGTLRALSILVPALLMLLQAPRTAHSGNARERYCSNRQSCKCCTEQQGIASLFHNIETEPFLPSPPKEMQYFLCNQALHCLVKMARTK